MSKVYNVRPELERRLSAATRLLRVARRRRTGAQNVDQGSASFGLVGSKLNSTSGGSVARARDKSLGPPAYNTDALIWYPIS